MSKQNAWPPRRDNFQSTSVVVVLSILIFLTVAWWQDTRRTHESVPTRHDQLATSAPHANGHNSRSIPNADEPSLPEFTPEPHDDDGTVSMLLSTGHHGNTVDKSYRVPDQSIRDLHGKVVFRGTIDLTPTIERIERGESNRHRNDGTTFQNREGRLPRKPAGYYKEYVHPTPGESGPGPQRIILGEEGEIWYTPDHYKTFQRVKPTGREPDE